MTIQATLIRRILALLLGLLAGYALAGARNGMDAAPVLMALVLAVVVFVFTLDWLSR